MIGKARSRTPWDDAQSARLMELWLQMKPLDAIAKELNAAFGTERTPGSVAIHAGRIGLKGRPELRPKAKNGRPRQATENPLEAGDQDHLAPRAAPSAKIRRCLLCRKNFFSEGAHNHVCNSCKGTDAWRYA